MLSGRTTTTVSAPARGPMDLNAGKPDWRELAPLFGLIVVAVLPTAAGGALVVANWRDSGEFGGWQALWLAVGAVLAFVGGSFIWTLRGAVVTGIRSYQRRVDEWHYAELEKFEASEGQVIASQVSEWTYTQYDMRHVALATLWVYLSGEKKLSIERLTKGPLQINLGHRSFKLMDMTQDGAAEFLNLLAASGVVVGRAPRVAGSVAMMDPKQAITRVLLEAAKNPQAISTPE